MIRKILITLMLAGMFSAHAQVEVFDGFILDTLTTAQLNTLPAKVKIKGAHFYNKDLGSLVSWNGTAWVAIGGAIADGSITEAKLNTSVNASLDLADSSVQPADLNSYVDRTSNETIGGLKTFSSLVTMPTNSVVNGNFYVGTLDVTNNTLGTNHISMGAGSAFGGTNVNNRIYFNSGRLGWQKIGQGAVGAEFDNNNTAFRIYTLPDASGTIALTSDIGASGDLWNDPVDADIVPDGNGTRDLGNGSNRFATAYLNTIIMGGNALSGTGNIIPLTTGSSIIGNSTYGYNSIYLEPTDTEPTVSEGAWYADESENRPKYYDGTSWKAFLLDGDAAGGASLPVDDTTALVQDPVDNTKTGLIDVGDVPTGTSATLSITANNQFKDNLKIKGESASNNSFLGLYKNNGTTIIGGVSGFGDTDKVELVNSISSESFAIDGSGNYNLSAFTGGGNLALAVDNSGNIYTTTISAGTIQSDTTGLGSTAYKPITNFIAWDYSVSTTPPTLTANEYAVQINGPANVAVDETMDGSDHQQKLIYDDRTADVATITFSNLELGQEIVIYFNRTALPTFSGATMKPIPTGSETFQADTETVLYGFVNPDGEIDYTIKELTP